MSETLKNILTSMCSFCRKRMLKMNKINLDSFNLASQSTECGMCFGILSKYSNEEFLKTIKKSVENSEIQFKDFRLSVTVPNYCYLRDKFIQLLLEQTDELKDCLRKPYFSVKDEWKRLNLEALEQVFGVEFNKNSSFELIVVFNIENLPEDVLLLASQGFHTKSQPKKPEEESSKQEFSKLDIDCVIYRLKLDALKRFYNLPLRTSTCNYDISCFHEPIYLAGRYLKYSRRLPQTPWVVEGKKRIETSIEEILSEFLCKKVITTQNAKLNASGREDVDVRCLGTGRPFILEFTDPKRTIFTKDEFKSYQKEFNSTITDIKVKDLQQISKEQTKFIVVGEKSKTKCYTAYCFSYTRITEDDIEKLNLIGTLTINQKTPIRVLHRRSALTRKRDIYEMSAKLVDDYHFNINLKTQAGTYIKEFVHGDYGRTEPSICTILNKDCDILELDVHAVNLDFPPIIYDSDDGKWENI